MTGVLVLRRIKNVQRSDAGEYRCRLSVSQMVVESQPITVKVEGEIQPCDGFLFFLSISFFNPTLVDAQVCQHSSTSRRTGM